MLGDITALVSRRMRFARHPSQKQKTKQWAISELLFVSASNRVLVLNFCKGNEIDLHENTQLISI